MSDGERRTALRFSLGMTAVQGVGLALGAAACWYGVYQYWFHFDEVGEPVRRRNQWFHDIMVTNGGMTGVFVFALFGLMCAWLALSRGWRFFVDARSAELTDQGLRLHPTFLRRGEIPFEDVRSAVMSRESRRRFPAYGLRIRFRTGRSVHLWSRTTEGGADALRAFAKELNARRTFEGGAER